MANVDRPDGLRPVKYLNGAPWNGQVNKYVVVAAHATAVFVGDVVELTGGIGANAGKEYRSIQSLTVTTTAATIAGVVVGFEENPLNLNIDGCFRPTGAQTFDRIAYVVDDPNVLFEAQQDAAGLTLTDIGLNTGLAIAAGSTATGRSAFEISNAGEATTATLGFKLVEFVMRPDNLTTDANTTGSRWLVKFNTSHQYGNTISGTSGV